MCARARVAFQLGAQTHGRGAMTTPMSRLRHNLFLTVNWHVSKLMTAVRAIDDTLSIVQVASMGCQAHWH